MSKFLELCSLTIWVIPLFYTATEIRAQTVENHPDVLMLPGDLENPPIVEETPAPGKMVLQVLPNYTATKVAHALYLPPDWISGNEIPVVIEYLGNGSSVRDNHGIGYGLFGGRGYLWAILPFVDIDGQQDTARWWGDVDATVAYAKTVIPEICRRWGGDPTRVVLVGYSRGAIACNYIGLHDDEIAKLWCGFIAASHYDDGHTLWGMSPKEQGRAPERLRRLGLLPQLICGEHRQRASSGEAKLLEEIRAQGPNTWASAYEKYDLVSLLDIEGTRNFIRKHHPAARCTLIDLPWVNHSYAVFLRNTPERQRIRAWLSETVASVGVAD